jgi:glycerophosphoryl diester phosphodiesterase
MLKIGHRGAMGYEPENTLLSFKKAIDLGVDMVELDVYKCKAGELVVIHDDKVDRTTNGSGHVMEKTLEELKKLDAGKGEKIPMLEEVFDLINRKVVIDIELKGEDTGEAVAVLIEKYVDEKKWSYDDFLVSSFHHIELRKFHELEPKVKIGALITGIPLKYGKFAEKIGAYSVHPSIEFIDQEFVDDCHRRNMKVFVYTVNDSDGILRMEKLGVDGIISDFPDKI